MTKRPRVDLLPTDFRQGELWTTKLAIYRLWFEYLALSPSYHLAHKHCTVGLKAAQEARLPADFDQVLAVYNDFGDVQRKLFLPWWRERGMQLCGFQGRKPRITRIAAIKAGRENEEHINERVASYLGGQWLDQGQQNTLLVAIPIGLPKSRIAKEVGALVGKYSERARSISPPRQQYALAGKRHNTSMLLRYAAALVIKAARPEQELWRTGVLAKVSDTYSPMLEANAKVVQNEGTYDRMMLTILTSRAIHRGRMIAENAARGVFPSYRNCEHALKIDFKELRQLYKSRCEWEEQQAAAPNGIEGAQE